MKHSHLDDESILRYLAAAEAGVRLADQGEEDLAGHLVECEQCISRARLLSTVRSHLDDVLNAWSAAEHGRLWREMHPEAVIATERAAVPDPVTVNNLAVPDPVTVNQLAVPDPPRLEQRAVPDPETIEKSMIWKIVDGIWCLKETLRAWRDSVGFQVAGLSNCLAVPQLAGVHMAANDGAGEQTWELPLEDGKVRVSVRARPGQEAGYELRCRVDTSPPVEVTLILERLGPGGEWIKVAKATISSGVEQPFPLVASDWRLRCERDDGKKTWQIEFKVGMAPS
jgi:hypothetical protein